MIIKNIYIENFRSYYDKNSMDLGEGLTLIIGANGDGKTTFFEALEWLFDTVNNKATMDSKYISKKKIAEMMPGDASVVKVSMTYESDHSERIVEKSFKFTKSNDNSVTTSAYSHCLYIQSGSEKEVKEGEAAKRMFDIDFSASIRKYCLFKGEQELNIFNKAEALGYLVQTFSKIRDFDPYISFTSNAQKWAQDATDNAMKADRKNSKEAERLRGLIRNESDYIRNKNEELRNSEREAVNFTTLLEELEKNKESSELLNATNTRIANLKERISSASRSISENYTFRLLDEMWILMGFEPVFREYDEMVATLDKEQRRLEREFQREQGAKRMADKMQEEINQGFVPLALNIPDENTMREMLHDEVCKVCGTPAPKGSAAYNTMKKHLEDYLNSLKETTHDEEEETLFSREFIRELANRYTTLHNNMSWLSRLPAIISSEIEKNRSGHSVLDALVVKLEQEEEQKRKILAQTEGLSEEQLISAYNNISNWWKQKNSAENKSDYLRRQIEEHHKLLDSYQEQYSHISEESSAAIYARSSIAIRRIAEAFAAAKVSNKREFLSQLEASTNRYLERLNKNDFRGQARIVEKADESAELMLMDTDGARIYNPNTALKTTMYMSLLFAVAELTTVKHEDDYPLIFDAPTSSFTAAKESDFFGVIGEINKQTIIVTKSFLIENADGSSVIDTERINSIKARKYRIEKNRPFDEKNLATIQTIIKPLN